MTILRKSEIDTKPIYVGFKSQPYLLCSRNSTNLMLLHRGLNIGLEPQTEVTDLYKACLVQQKSIIIDGE